MATLLVSHQQAAFDHSPGPTAEDCWKGTADLRSHSDDALLTGKLQLVFEHAPRCVPPLTKLLFTN